MDAVKALQQIHKEFTECSLCTEQYSRPKMLPCMHTFCLSCLEEYGKRKPIGEPLSCPLCRQTFTLHNGEFSCLPNNFNANRLVELRQSFSKICGDISWCKACNVDEDVGATSMAPADSYCVCCSQELCTKCASQHRDDGHSLKDLSPDRRRDGDDQSLPEFCSQHPKEVLSMFCLKCSSVVCVRCFCHSHNTHASCCIDEAAEKCTKMIGDELAAIRPMISKFKRLSTSYSRDIASFSGGIDRVEREIRDAAEKLKRCIDRHKIRLIQELKVKSQPTIGQLQKCKMAADSSISAIICLTEEVEKVKSSGDSLNIVRLSEKVKTERKAFEASLKNFGSTSSVQFYFFPSLVNDASYEPENLFGTIIQCDGDDVNVDDQEEEDEDDETASFTSENDINDISVVSNCGSDFSMPDLIFAGSPVSSTISVSENCTRCGWNHDVSKCTYPSDITCFRCSGNHHIRICTEMS